MGGETKYKKWEEVTLDTVTIYLEDKLSVVKIECTKCQMTWVFNKDKRRQRSLWDEAFQKGKQRNKLAFVGCLLRPSVLHTYGPTLSNRCCQSPACDPPNSPFQHVPRTSNYQYLCLWAWGLFPEPKQSRWARKSAHLRNSLWEINPLWRTAFSQQTKEVGL